MTDDPRHPSDPAQPLPPSLEAIRQDAMRKAAAERARAPADPDPDDGTPPWVQQLPRAGWWIAGIHGVLCVVGGLVFADRFRGEALFLAIFLSVMSQACLALPGLYMLRDALRPWAGLRALSARAPGVIEGDATIQQPGDGTWLESPGVAYVFDVGGVLFRGTLTATWASNSESINRRFRRRLPRVGTTVPVRFDPTHPERSAIIGHEPRLGCIVWIAAFLVLLGWVMAIGLLGTANLSTG